MINADGRPSGMAFVEFASPEDAATAMTKVTADALGGCCCLPSQLDILSLSVLCLAYHSHVRCIGFRLS